VGLILGSVVIDLSGMLTRSLQSSGNTRKLRWLGSRSRTVLLMLKSKRKPWHFVLICSTSGFDGCLTVDWWQKDAAALIEQAHLPAHRRPVFLYGEGRG